MPNCEFYATPPDHAFLLDWLFTDAACRVYESYSDFERPLRQFHSADEVLTQFERTYPNGKPWDTVYLQLYVLDAGPAFTPTRIELDPERCGGAMCRYSAAGWGLVQLHLSAPKAEHLGSSHTNHNSLKRAETWAPVVGLEAGPDAWDFERINAFSSRLNRQIRKQSVGKLGSHPVLPGASQLWEQGVSLSALRAGQGCASDQEMKPPRQAPGAHVQGKPRRNPEPAMRATDRRRQPSPLINAVNAHHEPASSADLLPVISTKSM